MNKRRFELTNELQEFFTQVSEVIDVEAVEVISDEVLEEVPTQKKKRGPRFLGELKRTEKYTIFFTKQEDLVLKSLAEKEGLCVAAYIHTVIKKALETATSNA